MNDVLRVEASRDTWVVRLNRPQFGNSLSAALVEDFHRAIDAFENAGARLLVIESEGRNFCTGFDLSDADGSSDGDLLLRFVRIEQLLARLWNAPFATVAVARGRAIGAGADLFAACSRRIAIEGASFRFPGAGFGLVLGTRRLAIRVGAVCATALVASGATIGAAEAVRLGLATEQSDEPALAAVLSLETASARRIDPVTSGMVRRAALSELGESDRDLALLVESASRPALGARIAEYRRGQAAHGSKA